MKLVNVNMMKIIHSILLLSIAASVKGQANFDSIKICHNAKNELSRVKISEYLVEIQKGQLLSLQSVDEIVRYEEGRKILTLRGETINGNYSLSLQLTSQGIVFCSADTIATVEGLKSAAVDTSISLNIGKISFPVLFHNGKLQRIWIFIGNKFASILIHEDNGIYNWDISIRTNTDDNELILTHLNGLPCLLAIHDDANKVGIMLFSDRKNGVFNILQGLRMYEGKLYGSDTNYRLRYSRSGALKSNKSGFSLDCK